MSVEIDLETAQFIRNAFLPGNPRKMRNCDERVRQAALRFLEAVETAERAYCRCGHHIDDHRTRARSAPCNVSPCLCMDFTPSSRSDK